MNFQNQIDEYLMGKLSEQETKSFQAQLLNDTDLALEVKKRKLILSGMEALAHQKMKQQIKAARLEVLDEQEDDKPQNASVKKMNFRWVAAVAAIITICVVAGYLFFQSKPTCEELFTDNFQLYEAEFGTRSNLDEKSWLAAENFYKTQKFNDAIPVLESLLKQQPTNAELELALGNAHLVLGKTTEAITYFESIIQRKDPLYSDAGRWYLALSYLKLENTTKAKENLKILIDDPKADFHQEAKELNAAF